MKIGSFFVGLVSICLLSCQSGVEIERISAENLFAVSSLISPQDSIVKVYVYQGKALGSVVRSGEAVIKDAKVSIEDDSTVHSLSFDAKNNSYFIDNRTLKVRASKSYRLRVSLSTGAILKGNCTVPPNPDKVVVAGNKEGNDYAFSIQKPANNVSFFTFNFELKNIVFVPKLGASTGPYLGLLVGNGLFDAKDFTVNSIENKVFNAYLAESVSLQTMLYSLDSHSYHYLKTRADAYTWEANTSGLIPNLKEPKPLYSNIEGGVGIFGAYNQSISLTPIQ
ncbi:DUF4249 domain-containing protein [Runella zeae]|uniref:DUF4249 domain-containing protein n=1 Tax=Runella zeae TaxID=94255 RepID=UPI000422610B|nr:DUF4249 domain-containing protein [Runella zeae]